MQVDENHDIARQLKAEAKRIEEDLAREREEAVRTKQVMRGNVMEGRAGIAFAAEKLAIEKRQQAEVISVHGHWGGDAGDVFDGLGLG
jgi:hypothetical protein